VVSYVFPLRHAVNAFTDAMAADASGWVLDAGHLAVIVLWGVAGLVVTLWRFTGTAGSARAGRAADRRDASVSASA
jgi:hypothetical protein